MIARKGMERTSGRIISTEELLRQTGNAPSPFSSTRIQEENEQHDARGLLISLGVCGVCWIGLAWFLLS